MIYLDHNKGCRGKNAADDGPVGEAALPKLGDALHKALGCEEGYIEPVCGAAAALDLICRGEFLRQGSRVLAVSYLDGLHAVMYNDVIRCMVLDSVGRINLPRLHTLVVGESVAVVHLTAVNAETGLLTDIAEVAKHVKQWRPQAAVCVDLTWAIPFTNLDSIPEDVDYLYFSGAGCGGCDHAAVIWSREEISAGAFGFPAPPAHDIHTLTTALVKALEESDTTHTHTAKLRSQLDARVSAIGATGILFDNCPLAFGISNYHIQGINTRGLDYLLQRRHIHITRTPHPASGSLLIPHVCGLSGDEHFSVGLSCATTAEDIQRAGDAIVAGIKHLRQTRSILQR